MKLFVFIASLLSLASASVYSGQAYHPYSQTISSLRYPGVQAVVSPSYIGIRRSHAPPTQIRSAPVLASPIPAVPIAPHSAPAHSAPAHSAPAHPAAVSHAVPSSQYHLQDEAGNFQYGYINENSAKVESGNADFGVKGSYSYVDGYGLPQKVDYVADHYGFRAVGTNFPNTAATSGHLLRHKRESNPDADAESKAESKADAGLRYRIPYQGNAYNLGYGQNYNLGYGQNYNLGYGQNYNLGYGQNFNLRPVQNSYPALSYSNNNGYGNNYETPAYGYGYSSQTRPNYAYATPTYAAIPAAAIAPAYATAGHVTSGYAHPDQYAEYAAPLTAPIGTPAVREADLLRIKLNPGHAESYRVY